MYLCGRNNFKYMYILLREEKTSANIFNMTDKSTFCVGFLEYKSGTE